MGMNEWLINIALELFDNYRKGYALQVYDTVESITGNKPIIHNGLRRSVQITKKRCFHWLFLISIAYTINNIESETINDYTAKSVG